MFYVYSWAMRRDGNVQCALLHGTLASLCPDAAHAHREGHIDNVDTTYAMNGPPAADLCFRFALQSKLMIRTRGIKDARAVDAEFGTQGRRETAKDGPQRQGRKDTIGKAARPYHAR